MDGEHIFKVSCPSEYADIPSYAKITFNKTLRDKIRRLTVVAESIYGSDACFEIKVFDDRITWLDCDKEESDEFRIEAVMLCVSRNSFKWRGYIRHTDDEVSLEEVYNPEKQDFFEPGDITKSEAVEESCKNLLRLRGDTKMQEAVVLASIREEVRSE